MRRHEKRDSESERARLLQSERARERERAHGERERVRAREAVRHREREREKDTREPIVGLLLTVGHVSPRNRQRAARKVFCKWGKLLCTRSFVQ